MKMKAKERNSALMAISDPSAAISHDLVEKTGKFDKNPNENVISIFKSEKNIITRKKKFNNSTNSKAVKRNISKVKTFFTDDADLLDQYYNLRHDAYNGENGWKDFNGHENDFDRNGRIVVAVTEEGRVVGGMRLMFSNENQYLSNEIPGTEFTYQKVIGKYDKRENLVFGEISGIVIHKEYRDRSVTAKSFESLIEEALRHGCQYVCGVGVAVVCRDYRIVFKSIGQYLEIVINLPWKQKQMYNFANMFPMYVKIA